MLTRNWKTVLRTSLYLLIALPLLGIIPSVAAGAEAVEAEVSSAVDLKFWGRAVFNMHYDTALQKADFMSFLTDDTKEEFNFNPRDTRFGFKASSAKGEWIYSAVFEIDFYGSNIGNNLIPRLRLGYAEAKKSNGLSIRGGQDWIPVAQQNPGTLDFGIQSWSGNLWWRVPQVTLRYKPEKIEFLFSAMKHRISNDQEAQEKMPWLLARMGFSDLLGKGSLLALGGGVRTASDVVMEKEAVTDTSDYNSYMLAFELKAPLGKKFVLNGEIYTGQGIGREFVHYGFDYNPWYPGGGREIESMGGFLSLKYAASDKICLNAGYGMDDPRDEDMVILVDDGGADLVKKQDGPYLKNQTIFANLKYAVTKQFGWGLEVINFTTTVPDGLESGLGTEDLKGQRFTTSWWYIF